jgi:hypothetical protein
VRTARARFRGPLAATATALTTGEVSPAHAVVVAAGTCDLPPHTAADAEPVLVEAARRLDPPRLRRVLAHLRQVLDPEAAASRVEQQHERRGLWRTATVDNLVALDGRLDPEAGQVLLAALEPLTRPATAADARSGSQRRADALTELARRALEAGRLPRSGGVRPQLAVVIDLDSLQATPRRWGVRSAGPGRWGRRRAGGWPATAPSPGSWPPTPPPVTRSRATSTTPATRMGTMPPATGR